MHDVVRYDHLARIDSSKGRQMRFVDILSFRPNMGEARFSLDGFYSNFTQLAMLASPRDAEAVQHYLDSRGYRKISFLGRGLYGLAFDTDGEFVLNIRTTRYSEYENFAHSNGIDTETVWSETTIPVDSDAILRPKKIRIFKQGNGNEYLLCETPKIQTLDEAIISGKITEEQAEYLRQKLMLKLAGQGYFLWDGGFHNIGIGRDFTPYVLDIGAATPFDKLTNIQFIKGITDQNLNESVLYEHIVGRDQQAIMGVRRISDLLRNINDFSQLPKDRVFDATAFRTFLESLDTAFSRDTVSQWDHKWVDSSGVPKQDSPAFFQQNPDANLFSQKHMQQIRVETGHERDVMLDAVEKDGVYRRQWREAVNKAAQDTDSELGFCNKIKAAVHDVVSAPKR